MLVSNVRRLDSIWHIRRPTWLSWLDLEKWSVPDERFKVLSVYNRIHSFSCQETKSRGRVNTTWRRTVVNEVKDMDKVWRRLKITSGVQAWCLGQFVSYNYSHKQNMLPDFLQASIDSIALCLGFYSFSHFPKLSRNSSVSQSYFFSCCYFFYRFLLIF